MKQRLVDEDRFDIEFKAFNNYLSGRKLNDADAVLLLNAYLSYLNFNRACSMMDMKLKKCSAAIMKVDIEVEE